LLTIPCSIEYGNWTIPLHNWLSSKIYTSFPGNQKRHTYFELQTIDVNTDGSEKKKRKRKKAKEKGRERKTKKETSL
jgi:hypothetical protein